MDYLNAAKQFIQNHFPNCSFALISGSIVRGEATTTSDLDIVIINDINEKTYRESFFEYGWPIEVFISTFETYKDIIYSHVKSRHPILPKMLSEGIVIKDVYGMESKLKEEANQILQNGPEPYSESELNSQRYTITNMIDDLVGSKTYEEEMFIVNELSEKIINFILVSNGQWMGRGKWLPKLLKKFDEELYFELINSMNQFYKDNTKQPFIDIVIHELNKHGGRLFQGYYVEA